MLTTCVIGDIHGCATSLGHLLKKVAPIADSFVFLGDYIDRGPDSRQVIDILISLKKQRKQVITLMGNHEQMLCNYIAGHDREIFLEFGGRQTLASYGCPVLKDDDAALCLPAEHRSFFEELILLWEDPHAIYVHAGLLPGCPLSMQPADACLWSRDRFLSSSFNFGKKVVFGHTVFEEPLIQENKIGIDTGAVYGGHLTALLLPQNEFIQVPGEQEHPYPVS